MAFVGDTSFAAEHISAPSPQREWHRAHRERSGAQRAAPAAVDDASFRTRDIAVAAVFLALLAPLALLIALAVKLDSRGPCLFVQTRGGRGGKPFRCIKFRTMSVMEDGDVVNQVTAGDRRVTRVGRFLRRTHLDEIPQLINVLRGDMALVGPRPHALPHDRAFRTALRRYDSRFSVRPGLTGYAQVSGFCGEIRSVRCVAQRLSADLVYIRHRSHPFDLLIVWLTALTVARTVLRGMLSVPSPEAGTDASPLKPSVGAHNAVQV